MQNSLVVLERRTPNFAVLEHGISIPTAPYFFKSGKHEGKSVECMMFSDYGLLSWMLKQMNIRFGEKSELNELHSHLAWIISQGESLKINRICHFCGKNNTSYFSARGDNQFGYSIGLSFSSCLSCRTKLKTDADYKTMILPFKFSSIQEFSFKVDRVRVEEFFKEVFLPGVKKLNPQIVFDLFSHQNSSL